MKIIESSVRLDFGHLKKNKKKKRFEIFAYIAVISSFTPGKIIKTPAGEY